MTRQIDSRINTQGLDVVHLNDYQLNEVIAELIDNSLDSYLKNKMSDGLIIDIKFNEDEIIYRDNANGFNSTDFDRAFQTHIPNNDGVAYGTYGVGMKHALLWLGRYTIVESISREENKGYRTVYPNIVDTEVQDFLSLEENLDLDLDTYSTRFIICEARKYRYNDNDLFELKNSLVEIYKYHRDKLTIFINDTRLIFSDKYSILNAKYVEDYRRIGDVVCLNNADSEDILWKYELPESLTTTEGGNSYSLSGFIGLQHGTAMQDSGIRIYRNNRCVLGFSANDRYRPFGSSNSHASKTFVGELHIEGFKKVTIGRGLPERKILDTLINHLGTTMRQGGFEDSIADKMFNQAINFRVNTHPLAPLCASIGPVPGPIVPPIGPGPTGPSGGGGGRTLPTNIKTVRIQIADQSYHIKSQMVTGQALVEANKKENGEIEINLKMNMSLQDISMKLFAELYDVHQKLEEVSGLNPDDELKNLLNRLR